MFTLDQDRMRDLYALLHDAQDNSIPFEDRFQVVSLHHPLEDLLTGREDRVGEYHYCFFANARGIRHVAVSLEDAELARKIRAQAALTAPEKERALELLVRLSSGEVVSATFDQRTRIYGNG